MVGPNQYDIAAANDSNSYILYSQTFEWGVNVLWGTLSMPLFLVFFFISPIQYK